MKVTELMQIAHLYCVQRTILTLLYRKDQRRFVGGHNISKIILRPRCFSIYISIDAMRLLRKRHETCISNVNILIGSVERKTYDRKGLYHSKKIIIIFLMTRKTHDYSTDAFETFMQNTYRHLL